MSSTPTTTNEISIQNASTPDNPIRKSTWTETAWVTGGCATLLFSLTKTITTATATYTYLKPCIAALAGYILADLGSGIYHWAIDNYGSPSTPIFGKQITGFLNHHKRPYMITKTPLANNLRELAQGVIFSVMPITLGCDDPMILAFVSVFSGFVMFSQQFHAWSHETRKVKLPRVVLVLQEAGVLLSRNEHGRHHRPPFDSNYCIVSGVWNRLVDDWKVFHRMEMVIFVMSGVKPRSRCEEEQPAGSGSGSGLEWIGDDQEEDVVPTNDDSSAHE